MKGELGLRGVSNLEGFVLLGFKQSSAGLNPRI
jgi:hypothetical protein